MIEVTITAAKAASQILLKSRKSGLNFKNKERLGDFTTDADIASEKVILGILKKAFPKHSFISEELGEIKGDTEKVWLIDPLDGTIPFSSGMVNFGVSIGFLDKGVPKLGVISLPALDCLYHAQKDKGAHLNGKRIRVSEKSELLKSVVGMEFAYVGTRNDELKEVFSPLVDKVRYTPVLGSSIVGSVNVACGIYDAYIHSAHPWDFAAGSIIIEEAGGKITDYKGKKIDWSKNWIKFFASNNLIHDKILALINK